MTETTVVDTQDSAISSTEVTNTNADAVQLAEALQKLEKTQALVDKLRANEKHNQQVAKEVGAKNLEDALRALQQGVSKEAEEWKNKYDSVATELTSLKEGLKNQQLDSVLKETLSKANVKDINTVLKVVDKSQIQWKDDQVDTSSIEAIVEGLRKSDPILFNEPQLPDVKPAGFGNPIGGFEKEISVCRSQKEIEAVLKKYGKK